MKQAILDTNFILTCIKEKIDFIEGLQFQGFTLVVPEQVIGELEKLSKRKGAVSSRAEFALRLLDSHNLKKIDLETRKVDFGLSRYSKNNPDSYIATIDSELKRKVKRKIVIRGKNKLEVL